MLAPQLLLDAPRAEIALTAQMENPGLFLLMNLALGAGLGATALGNQARLALLLIAPQPLAQRWTGDPTATTDQADVLRLLVEPDPC